MNILHVNTKFGCGLNSLGQRPPKIPGLHEVLVQHFISTHPWEEVHPSTEREVKRPRKRCHRCGGGAHGSEPWKTPETQRIKKLHKSHLPEVHPGTTPAKACGRGRGTPRLGLLPTHEGEGSRQGPASQCFLPDDIPNHTQCYLQR